MKIVIDIPEDYFEVIQHDVFAYGNDYRPFRIIADGKPLQTGTWKAHEDSKIPGYWHYGCSVCGCEAEKARNYCPNCGARLEGIWLIAKVKRIG